ncbi:SDR family NAD(P)-dependent oxidoreductase [Halovenus sp. WSH3]|uniref:SDR family NAD(P)-dependent oxidoreductase n=1 Tax=Halovenus carboxidivorans TaxID=2692199 RepID=A0A6B0SYW3_9EURY|nr:SDR family NAD(P)-dependent oxidoreductase [Halovenus carboxidivorans]MXR50794.1 SDR family NAD(P)-dependent oxidoreductase [Halovenus carboxidivorans]
MFGFDRPPEEQAKVADADCSDLTVLVTGSTSGIGRVGARSLGRLGAHVIVHGRDTEAGREAVDEIDATDGTAEFIRADFTDPDEISALADGVRESVDRLDVLCNNAGGLFQTTEPTELGVDPAFQVNHLAPYQLTAELLDTLGPGSRVVTTSSLAHRGTTLNLDELLAVTGLSTVAAYCRSKLANVQFAAELARRLAAADRAVTSNSFHPGVIPGSEFGRAFPGVSTELWQLFDQSPFTESVEEGAATMVYLAVSEDVAETTGAYFARRREHRPSAAARDRETQRRLWERSAQILGIEEPLAAYADAAGPSR